MKDRKIVIEEIMQCFHTLKRSPHRTAMVHPALTPSQWQVVRIIAMRETTGIKDIAQELSISSSAATQLIDTLVEAKIVQRKIGAEDRRKSILTLSPKTKTQLQALRKEAMNTAMHVFSTLSDSDLENYHRINTILTNTFTKK